MKYYIIAGERSGDLHGGNLINALRREDPDAVLRGFGGDEMKAAGMELYVHYEELAIMGFIALISSLFKIMRYIAMAKRDIAQFQPDVIILIDYGGFNRRIAKYGKGNGTRVFYYIPPKVWAWYQSRAWELKRNVDRMFVILPFEKNFYKKYDVEVDYVGSPVLEAVKAFVPNAAFSIGGQAGASVVALLPGSRKLELKFVVPLMSEVARMNPQMHFVVAAIEYLPAELYQPLRNLPNVSFVFNQTYDLLNSANAAIVTSGTATLETSLFKVPQVVVYKTGKLEFLVVSSLVRVPWISLVNLIADKPVVKELIQKQATPELVNDELQLLLREGTHRQLILDEYDRIYNILDTGNASINAAKLMVQYLKKD